MTLSDDQLLDFDRSRIGNWDEERARRLLVDQPEFFRNHLAIARWIDRWTTGIEEAGTGIPEYDEGFVTGLRDVAAHLRQGDLVPGGPLMHD
jgi:hypothetical protein